MSESRTESPWLGYPMERKEDFRLTTGGGRYIADLGVPGTLHLAFVRSAHAHARLLSIDVSKARAVPGVVAVVTGEDIKDEIRPLPLPVVLPAFPARYPTFWPLAIDKVKFHGEPVAAIVARDAYVAEDAAELVEIEYEPLPAVVDAEAALGNDTPLVHEDWDDNVMFAGTLTGGDDPEDQARNAAEVQKLIDEADVVVRRRFRVHRTGVTPLETRGALADWSPDGDLTAWITTQRPHIDRLALADQLRIPSHRIRVIAPRDQGGAFGVKAPFYREPTLVCHMARMLARPVRWIESREEHLMAVSQERDQTHDIEVAATADGRITAVRDRALGDAGDGCSGVYWGYVMPLTGAAYLPNAYDLPTCDISIRVAVTNKSSLSPARAFGRFPTRFVMERCIDLVARALGMEPAEVRRRNFVRSFPHVICTGVHYDSGDFAKTFENLVEQIDLEGFRKEQAAARARGRYLGIGFGVGVESSGVASEVLVPMENQPGYGAATVRLDPHGKAFVFEGDAPGGQGHETMLAQVAANEFGIHPDDVVVTVGDTGKTPFGSGTIGARAGSYTASAVAVACRVLKEKIGRFMIHDLGLAGAEPADFTFANGQVVYARDDNIRRSFVEMTQRIIMRPIDLPPGESGGLEHTAFFEAEMPLICFSCHGAIVEVDPETGQFTIERYVTSEDFGVVINPKIIEGQVQGAVVQGLSNTMFEQFVYDENGQQLSTSLETYQIARAPDVPPITVTHAGVPCPYTPFGARGAGEGLPGPVPATLANAVSDALQPFGVEIDELPLRPNRIWAAIRRSGKAAR